MKKRLAAAIMTLTVTLCAHMPVWAYCTSTSAVSASDLNGPVPTPEFAFETNMNWEMVDKFWEISTEQQNEVKAYYGYDDLATSIYAGGTLDLSNTQASESNPVTVTFSLSADWEWDVPMANEKGLYVMQKLPDGSCKMTKAASTADATLSASFTDACKIQLLLLSIDIAREGLNYWDIESARDISGVQSAVDKNNNPVTVTVAPLDADLMAIAADAAGSPYGEGVLAFADVSLQGATASADNPITVTFLVEGVKPEHEITVVHKKADGTWETLTGTAGDGTVTATFTSFSPVAIVNNSLKQKRPNGDGGAGGTDTSGSTNNTGNTNDSGSTPTGNTNTTNTASAAASPGVPQTGDAGVLSFAILAIASASAGAAALYSIQRKRSFFTKK